ncbi:MAG TPA: SemiSWEET family transporter [Micromonosporaceae bacterium]|nr:SemiSWEET family transporter [Micromonosporaceae bacterium]
MTALGLIAGLLTTLCWVPQLARTLRTRSTDDISWAYLAVLATGLALWLAYGVLRGDPAIIGSNVLALACVATLMTVKTAPRREAP